MFEVATLHATLICRSGKEVRHETKQHVNADSQRTDADAKPRIVGFKIGFDIAPHFAASQSTPKTLRGGRGALIASAAVWLLFFVWPCNIFAM